MSRNTTQKAAADKDIEEQDRPVSNSIDNQTRRYKVEKKAEVDNLNLDPGNKFPNIKGEKTISCWNCQSILMIKEEWSVVQCTNCEKINRVPGIDREHLRLNDNMNHFDIHQPYVFIIIVCPFCRSENKARKDAEHVVCFKCNHSVSIFHDNKIKKEPNNLSYPMNKNVPQRSQRLNDAFIPNPYDHYSNQIYEPSLFRNALLDSEIEKYLKLEYLKNKYRYESNSSDNSSNRFNNIPKKFNAVKFLVQTVDEITEDLNMRPAPCYKHNNTTREIEKNRTEKENNYNYNVYTDNNSKRLGESPFRSIYKNTLNMYDFDNYRDFKKSGTFSSNLGVNLNDFILSNNNK